MDHLLSKENVEKRESSQTGFCQGFRIIRKTRKALCAKGWSCPAEKDLLPITVKMLKIMYESVCAGFFGI
jgi:hypothetical protein